MSQHVNNLQSIASSRLIGSILRQSIGDAAAHLDRLEAAANALYMAGRWSCNRSVNEAALWEELRDALNLPVGTATQAGVAGD